MTDRISIFNYEAFYLDYLEGRLNESDVRALLSFLKEHPELQIEEQEFSDAVFSSSFEKETSFNKNSLKMFDEADEVTMDNVDDFIIANLENTLSIEKQEELRQFIVANNFEEHKEGFTKTIYTPDLELEYHHKASLKRKTIVIAWQWYAAAAVIAFVFFLLIPQGKQTFTNEPVVTSNKEKKVIPVKNELDEQPTNTKPLPVVQNDEPILLAKSDIGAVKNYRKTDVEKLKTNRPGILGSSSVNKAVEPLTPNLVSAESSEDELMAKNSLKLYNPIEPITKIISDKTNTPIEFEKSTADSERKGFHVRIGKFEVSRTSRRK